MPIYGVGRMRWQWQGACYTSAGIKVPQEVMENDDALIENDEDIPDDLDVLDDLRVTLPLDALPDGAQLAAPPKKN